MSETFRTYAAFTALALLSVFLVNCGSGVLAGSGGASAAGASSVTIDAAGLAAFQAGLYKFATSPGTNCSQCHNSAGENIQPTFADANLNTAYLAARGNIPGSSAPLVDFTDPTSSAFVTYSGNSHCGVAACSSSSNPATVTTALQAWATAELQAQAAAAASGAGSGSGSGDGTAPAGAAAAKYFTNAMLLPANIPQENSKTAASIVRIKLSSLGVASVANAILEIQVQIVNSDTVPEYRISSPKIGGNSAPVSITGIHVFVAAGGSTTKGSEDFNNGSAWDSLTTTAAAFTLPGTLPATSIGATVLQSSGVNLPAIDVQGVTSAPATAPDQVTIGFESIQ